MSWIQNLRHKEFRLFSQHGEDGITLSILKEIGVNSRHCVEIAAGPQGTENCTRVLVDLGDWSFRWFDKTSAVDRVKELLVTRENVNGLVRPDTDVLSIDVDGMDYWLWRAIKADPRLVIIEYNGAINAVDSVTVPYSADFSWQADNYHGASLKALDNLALAKGYSLIYCDSIGVNAFFVRNDLLPIRPPGVQELYNARKFDFGWKGVRSWEIVNENGEPAGEKRVLP